MERCRPAGLTAREVEVLGLIAVGLQSKQIAQHLYITPKTVGHHIGHIYMKIGASNRVTASLYATQQGLVPAGAAPQCAGAPSGARASER
jgi:DNA-binding CsgD family transcriptional regulator